VGYGSGTAKIKGMNLLKIRIMSPEETKKTILTSESYWVEMLEGAKFNKKSNKWIAQEIIKAHSDEWISVEYETPIENTEVIIYYYHEYYGEWMVGTAIYEQGIFNNTERIEDFSESTITHWQPLPEPPKKIKP
jgi:hypothetical protein